MEREYWFEKTKGHAGSMQRLEQYLRTNPDGEAELLDLMEQAETHYPNSKGSFLHRLVEAVMDEMTIAGPARVQSAIDDARKNRISILAAIQKIKQTEARERMRAHFPKSEWVNEIKKEEIVLAAQIVESLRQRQIPADTVDLYVRRHPFRINASEIMRNPVNALRHLGRMMETHTPEVLKEVMQRVQGGQPLTEAWKEVTGKAKP